MLRNYQIGYMRRHVKVREERPLSFLRQSVAYMLSQSARNIPHAAGITTFDVTPLVEYGKSEDERLATCGHKLNEKELLRRAVSRNFSAFFIKMIAHIMHQVPCMNGFFDYTPLRNGGTFYQAEDINLSFTVHTRFGVVKPVVHNPHEKPLEQVADEMRKLTRKARRTDMDELYFKCARAYMVSALREMDISGWSALVSYLRSRIWQRWKKDAEFEDVDESEKLQVEDVLGATCTVANIGMTVHGHQTVTVIIPPEVTMWGIGDLHLAPAVVDGEVVPRYQVTLALTLDHRALDGGDVFPFVDLMRNYIDHPELIYDWKPGDPV